MHPYAARVPSSFKVYQFCLVADILPESYNVLDWMGQRDDDVTGPNFISGHNVCMNLSSNRNLLSLLENCKNSNNHKGRHPPLEPEFIELPEAHSMAHAYSLHPPPSAHQGHHVTGGGAYPYGLSPAHAGPQEAEASPLNLSSESSSYPGSCSGSPRDPREPRELQEPMVPPVTQNSDLIRRLQAPLAAAPTIRTAVPVQGPRYVPIKRRAPSDTSHLGSVGTGSPCTSGAGSPSSSDPDTAPPPPKKKSNRGRKPGQCEYRSAGVAPRDEPEKLYRLLRKPLCFHDNNSFPTKTLNFVLT